jgi:hypothetical protein
LSKCRAFHRNRANCPSFAFFPGYVVFKNENVKVKIKHGFVLYTDLSFAIKIAQIGNQNKGIRMNILQDFRIFFIEKGSYYRTLVKARKIPALLL